MIRLADLLALCGIDSLQAVIPGGGDNWTRLKHVIA